MPKVIGYTAPWLSRPADGSRIFSDPAPQSPRSPTKQRTAFLDTDQATEYQGPRRLIARRGTEIFTVVGNSIRWADLATVKEKWTEQRYSRRESATPRASEGDDIPAPYRTLSTPVYYQIRQLIISPSGVFLAICTEHTVHIAVLPDSSRLTDQDKTPIKLKTYQLGPTTHVIPESPVVSALWHPLAVATDTTDCFVTVTSEAAVRLWEVDRSNRGSFERPALAVDLKRLVDGVSSNEDFEPSPFGKNRGFSVDAFDMEVSAACFGGQGRDEENAWASMTLWTTMRNGDIYALCPFLPSKWIPTSTTIPSLSTATVAKMAALDDREALGDEVRTARAQYEWVREIDNNEPLDVRTQDENEPWEVRLRPSNLGLIPRLQGPFDMPIDEDLEISDIHVFAAHLDDGELMSGEEGYGESDVETGLPFTVVCLATTSGDILIAMNMEGVSGQWLQKRSRESFGLPEPQVQELLLIESLPSVVDVPAKQSTSSWPVFMCDDHTDYTLFMTGFKQIALLSLTDWASHMSMEVSSTEATGAGLETRLKTVCSGQICVYDELLKIMDSAYPVEEGHTLTAPVVFNDAEFGYMLLTATESQAHSLLFDSAHADEFHNYEPSHSQRSRTPVASDMDMSGNPLPSMVDVPAVPQRAPYTPSAVLYKSATGAVKDLLTRNLPQRQKMTLIQQIRLSPATLDLMTCAHRMLSSKTQRLNIAAAELFRQCERMREELADQVKQMVDLADKLQSLSSMEVGEVGASSTPLDERIENARSKQIELQKRFEDLRRKSGRANRNKELNEKETAWIGEITTLSRIVGIGEEEAQVGGSGGLSRRYQQLQQISKELLAESKRIGDDLKAKEKVVSSPGGTVLTDVHISSKLQKSKLADAMAMVEREAAVIEAVQARLQKLTAENSE